MEGDRTIRTARRGETTRQSGVRRPGEPRLGSAPSGIGRRLQDERGAILVHVAVAFVALVGFSVLTIDLGVVWVARTQAQNAADAGALAGAVSLAYAAPGNNATAEAAASAVAMANPVWGQAPNVSAGSDAQVVTCPAGVPTPGDCVSVNVRRTAENGAALPVYFAPVLSLTSPDVQASAWAQATAANETTCLKPWAIPDRWIDNVPPIADFDAGGMDDYTPPSQGDPGSGYTVTDYTAIEIHMSEDVNAINQDWYVTLDLSGSGSVDDYGANISGCFGAAIPIGGQPTAVDFPGGANRTYDAVMALIAQDPNATWGVNGVQGSNFVVSPRIVAIALFNPESYPRVPYPFPVQISNIAGMFIEEVQLAGATIRGHLMPLAGTFSQTAPQVTEDSSFLRAITLVR